MTRNRVFLAAVVLLVASFMVLLFLALVDDADIQVHANAAPQRQNLDKIQPISTTTSTTTTSAPKRMRGEWPWDALARCESGGDWSYDGPSGFDGGVQFAPSTWTAYAPPGYPMFAHQASREQQIEVARIVVSEQGWGAWPKCSRRLGLR